MNETLSATATFEASRARLVSVAYRILGSHGEAEDAVQEAWFKLRRSDVDGVANLEGWLTTVVARGCLDLLRARRSRREDLVGTQVPDGAAPGRVPDPAEDAARADEVGLALSVVLDLLAPAERVAFVLHDMFDVPFDEIAPIVGRSSTATRKLASRARIRVHGGAVPQEPDPVRQREVVDAFLAAARGGQLDVLLSLLDPDVVLTADDAAVLRGVPVGLRGAGAVAENFRGRAQAAVAATVDGLAGAVWPVEGRVRVVFEFTVKGGLITGLHMVADEATVAEAVIEWWG